MSTQVARRDRVLLVVAVIGMYFCSFFQRFTVPGPIFGDIQQTFMLTAAQVTALGSVYLFIYALMQPLVGLWADRWGGAYLVLWGGACLVAGSWLFPLSGGQTMLYASRSLIAIGDGVMYLSVLKEVDKTFSGKNFAPVLGIACLIGSLGGLLATTPFRWMVDLCGWRWTFIFTAMWTLLTYGFFIMQARRCRRLQPLQAHKNNLHPWHAVQTVIRNIANYPVMFGLSFSYSVCFSLQVVIGVKFLVDRQHLSAVEGSGFTFAMLVVSLIWMTMAAPISSRFGNRRKIFLIGGTFCGLIGSVLLFCGADGNLPNGVIVLAMCLCSMQAGNVAVTTSQLRELNQPEVVATVVGLLNAFTYLVIAVLAALIGQILDLYTSSAIAVDGELHYPATAYAIVFALFIAVTAASSLCAWFSRETRGIRLS